MTFTPSQELGRLIVNHKTLSKPPFWGADPIDLCYGFAGFEFWHDENQVLYVAVVIPDEAHLVKGLLALVRQFEKKLFQQQKEAMPVEWQAALIVPFGKVKTTFPENLTVFVLPPEFQLLLELGE